MKSIRSLALLAGLLALSGVSQAQFSSTWTAVSDYDFRGWSQSSKNPALQASADYAFGESGFSAGAWASNVDFGTGSDADVELDIYANYVATINDTFAITAGVTYYSYPGSDTAGEYPEIYVGFNAGNFAFKQWYAEKLFDIDDNSAQYTEANYTQPIGDNFSLAFHVGYAWGDAWEAEELIDYAVQANWTFNKFTIFGKFTGTDADDTKVETDANNNEPRFLIGAMTTFPWGD
jgi:uncharacterized protein (TIGR02001 family)